MGDMNGRAVPQLGQQKWQDGNLYEYSGPVGGWGVVHLSEKELADRLLHDQISGAPPACSIRVRLSASRISFRLLSFKGSRFRLVTGWRMI